MIVCVDYENLPEYGRAFRSQFLLRHECFIERQDYNVCSFKGMEYDQYDTPAATYLVYLAPSGEALGCSRMTPVSQGSMLKDIWPGLVSDPEKTFTESTWEGTRFCIKKNLPVQTRLKIRRELVVGYLEFGLTVGATKIIGVMPPPIFKRVFIDAGCEYEFLGVPQKIPSGETILAAAVGVSETALEEVKSKSGVHENVIINGNIDSQNLYRLTA